MAIGASDALRLVVSADTAGAVREFDKLGKGIKSSVGEVDKQAAGLKGALTKAFDGLQAKSSTVSGLFDKLGVSSGQAAGAISTAIPLAAVAAGGALAAFAAKGVQAFQETALAAGKFADSTGLSVDAASRYVAIADDIGIGAGTIQNAFIKMEKAMGSNRAAFSGFIATAKGGGTDLSQTFLNVVTHLQGIQDPIQRATESSKLFGKGFAEVSELINTDAGKIKDSLSKVSDEQVISDAELKNAREYRAAMDNLGDAVRDLSIDLGQQLVPALADAANGLTSFIQGAKDANSKSGGLLGDLFNVLKDTASPLDNIRDKWKQVTDAFDSGGKKGATGFDAIVTGAQQMGAAIGPAGTSVGDLARSFNAQDAAIATARAGYDEYLAAVQASTAALDAQNAAIAANSDAQLAAFDATFAVTKAQNDFAKAHLDSTIAQNDSTKSAGEQQVAYDAETQAAEAAAVAVQKKAEKDAIASGKALTAAESNDILISALQAMSAQATGPTKAALDTLISSLQKTGDQHPTPDVTLNDQASGPLANVDGKLNTIDGKTASASVTVNTTAANQRLDQLNARLARGGKPGTGGTFTLFAHGGMVGGPRGAAQAAIVHGGEYVLSEDVVSRIKNGQQSSGADMGPGPLSAGSGSGGTVVQITVNGAVDPYSTARQIQTILAKGGYAGFSAKAA
jgi:hypothetical protein